MGLIKHVVLVGEGAGAKMPLISAPLEYIETKTGMHVEGWADLAVTTSASSVVMTILATGRMTAKDLNVLLLSGGMLQRMFNPRSPLAIPRYSRDPYTNEYKAKCGDPVYMNEAENKLIVTSFGACDGRTHFFKSWEEKDGKLRMTEVGCRSFAAPYFFGEMQDDRNRQFWGDGGLGVNNMPAWFAYAEARKQGWLAPGHHTHFLLLGGGYSKYWLDFEKAGLGGAIRQLFEQGLNYLNLKDGGLAKASSTVEQVNFLKFLSTTYDPAGASTGRMTVDYCNWENMPAELDKMDNWKASKIYYDKGMELATKINLEALKK